MITNSLLMVVINILYSKVTDLLVICTKYEFSLRELFLVMEISLGVRRVKTP